MVLTPRSSYYDREYKATAALLRARRPYLFKNMITGAGLFAFTISVYAFTIHAVGQEEFADVKVPDAPSPPPRTPNVAVNGST